LPGHLGSGGTPWAVRTLSLAGGGELRRARLISFDTGVGSVIGRLDVPAEDLGSLVETFVLNELRAQASWSSREATIEFVFWRYRDRAEVDIVLVHPDGGIVAIEVKMSSQPLPAHTRGLASFRQRYERPDRPVRTYVFYLGDRVVPYQEHWFVPISALGGLG